jgi:hypothetical protein
MVSIWPRSAIWTAATKNSVVSTHDARGSLNIYLPKPDLCITRVKGHLSNAMARDWMDALDPHFRRGVRFTTFHEWAQMESYESAARRALTAWVIKNRKSIVSADFLVLSRLVAMGVQTASLATTLAGLPMHAHRDRDEFEHALTAHL